MAEMKIIELSIGDWVRYESTVRTVPMKVLEIGEKYTMSDGQIYITGETEGGRMFCEITELKPILLTPEILEKNGFVKKNYDNGKMWDWWCDNVLVRKFADEDIYRFIVVFNSKHYTTMMVVGKHTHQLQHALRLAGIEKEIEV